jgi:peptidyl-prolyl cis-trans isomerase C
MPAPPAKVDPPLSTNAGKSRHHGSLTPELHSVLKGNKPMKKMSVLTRASVLAVSMALAAPLAVHAQNIATVNGKPVPKSRADNLLKQATRQSGQPATPELEKQVRDEVVLREMFAQEAEKKGVAASPSYKAQIELARQSILIRELFAQYEAKNPVTDAEVETEYNKYKAMNAGNEYRASHILVDKEEDAKALIAQIKGGAKFEDLAKKNSKDPGSGEKGGDLDWAAPNAFVKEFSDAMVGLKKGELAQTPVKTQFGYHVIRLDDVREVQFPALAEVKDQIKQQLGQQKVAEYREQIRAKAKTDYKFAQ